MGKVMKKLECCCCFLIFSEELGVKNCIIIPMMSASAKSERKKEHTFEA
jgi:hypothetical protein